MKDFVYPFFIGLAEILFIATSIVLLPLWFPLLILWIVLDIPYHVALRNSAKANERFVRKKELVPFQ